MTVTDVLWFWFQASSDIWFDCCENSSELIDNVVAGVISSDSESETDVDAKFIPCLGRGLAIPPLHDVHMPRVAFLNSQVRLVIFYENISWY